MKSVMKNFKEYVDSFVMVFGIISMVVLLFTTPTWLIWNHIIAPKFEIPTFTFWEIFFTLLMIKITFPEKTIIKKVN